MIGWLIVGAVRSAARNSGRQGRKPKEWQPLTKILVIVGTFAVMIEMGGGWRDAAFVIIGLIAVSVLIAIVCCSVQAAERRNQASARKRAEDKALDDILSDKPRSKP